MRDVLSPHEFENLICYSFNVVGVHDLLILAARCDMRFHCPFCSEIVIQSRNAEGPNFCQKCGKLFVPPPPEKVPTWVLGVLVFLTANWQIMFRLHGM
jgi:hypothetical protein